MKIASIPHEAANSFDLPPVCILSGRTDDVFWRKQTFTYSPSWVWILALAGLFCFAPLLIVIIPVAAVLQTMARAELPYSRSALAELRRRQWGSALASLILITGGVTIAALGILDPDLSALTIAASAILSLVLVYVLSGNRSPRVKSIDNVGITLALPSDAAVIEINRRLGGRFTPAQHAGRPCEVHPEEEASLACPRCGDFACRHCLTLVPGLGRMRICTGCATLRQQKSLSGELNVPLNDKARTAFLLGLLSLIPFFGIVAWIANLFVIPEAFSKARRLEGRGRGRAIAALVMTLIGFGFFGLGVLGFFLARA